MIPMASPSKTKTPSAPDPAAMTFEAAVGELESTVAKIEAGEVPLEEALALHRRGQALVDRCRSLLADADQELRKLSIDDAEPPAGD
jgi:exodeoxyribonuclease VII small subunit